MRLNRLVIAAALLAASFTFTACGDVPTSPSVVPQHTEAGSVVSILDHPQPVKPQGSTVIILRPRPEGVHAR